MTQPSGYGLGLVILLMLLTVIGLVAISRQALSHEWFTNLQNPVTGAQCCNGMDCVILDEDRWWETGGKIFVRWFDHQTYSMPSNQAAPSQDKQGKAAACVYNRQLRCFFMPLSY